MGLQKLDGKVCLVTGASRGLGAEIALELAKEGVKVALVARDENRLSQVKEAILECAGEAESFPCDITNKTRVFSTVDKITDKWGSIDILINNAGMAHWASVMDMTEDQWDEMMGTNLKGVFLMTQAVLPHFIGRKSGDIVNISSVMGHSGAPNLSGYCTTKFGLEGFAQSLYTEVKPYGIRVSNLAPAMIDTEFRDHMEGRRPYTSDELSRMLTVKDIASAVKWVLTSSVNANISNLTLGLHRL